MVLPPSVHVPLTRLPLIKFLLPRRIFINQLIFVIDDRRTVARRCNDKHSDHADCQYHRYK